MIMSIKDKSSYSTRINRKSFCANGRNPRNTHAVAVRKIIDRKIKNVGRAKENWRIMVIRQSFFTAKVFYCAVVINSLLLVCMEARLGLLDT